MSTASVYELREVCHDIRPPIAGVLVLADVIRVVSQAAAAERQMRGGDLTLVWPSEPVSARPDAVILRRMTASLLADATRAGTLERGRSSLGGGRMNLWLPLAARTGGRAADATCAM